MKGDAAHRVGGGPCSLVTGRPIKSRRGEYFRAWVAALEAVGFKVDWKVVCCADFGDPTTRRRFFLIGRSDGQRLTWPEFTHDRVGGTDLLGSRPRWRGAREVIDWTMTGKSIFTRTKPLKPNTLRRILAGAVKYSWPRPYIDAVQALLDGQAPKLVFTRAEAVALGLVSADPMLVHLRGTSQQHLQATAKAADEPLPTLTAGGGHVGLVLATSSGGAARDLDQPLPTITTGGAGAERPGCARPQLVEPIIVPTSNTSSAGVPRSAAEPIRTVTTAKGGDQALAVPLVAQYYGATATAQSVAEPVPSVTTKARFGLAEPVVMRGNVGTGRTCDMRPASEPMPTITCSESLALAEPFLVPNFSEAPGQTPRTHSIDDPMPTVTATGHVQLASPSAEVADEVRIDINYRMLHWRELARATSFDDEGEVYDFAGNATEITKQIGNAVPNRTAKALAMGLMRDAA
ncbi:TPA: DNA cytosine methyltransferase [Stenotrophomonas maltophilia]